jgi:ABC-type branched-subunit amino acid transport system ATPase component
MPFVPGSRRLLPLGEHASAEAWRRAADALVLVGLADMGGSPAGKLSYGQRKLLDIARVIAAAPKIVLLDEPVAGVDAISANRVKCVIEHLRAKGCTVLLVEHNMRFVMGLSDRVVVLNSGAVIAEGTPSEIARNEAVIHSYLGTRDHAKTASSSREALPVPRVQLATQG